MHVYQCIICRIVLFTIDEIRLHMDGMHPEYRSIYCGKENCMQMINTDIELNVHWTNEHANIIFQCLACFKLFERREFAQNHLAKDHVKLGTNNEISIKMK